MADVFPRSSYVSGAWLLHPNVLHKTQYKIGYQATVISMFSYGVAALVTYEVAEAFVKDIDGTDDEADFHWDDDFALFFTTNSDEQRLGPDDAGMYELPAWAWQETVPGDCDEVRENSKTRFTFTLEATGAWETWSMEAPAGTPDFVLRAMFESGDHEKALTDAGNTSYAISTIEEN